MTIPPEMNAVLCTGPGGPEVMVLGRVPTPKPGPSEVLVRVTAAGVNRPDIMQRQGAYPPPPGAPDIMGLEIAGTVTALGEGTHGLALGDRVTALVAGGGYAAYCVAPASLCLPVPRGLSMIEAAGLPETVFTVWDNVFTRGRLASGESLLVHGGTSGIGTTAIQLAVARGARVIATAGTDEKCAFCRKLGAARAINYRTGDFVAEAKAMTEGRGVDVVLDMVGAEYFARNVAALAVEGRLVSIATQRGAKTELDLVALMVRRLTLAGSTLRPRSVALKTAIAEAVRAQVWPLIEAGRVRPIVHATFPLARASDAHRLMESGVHTGKIILVAEGAEAV
ncbi:MAG: NAD(P)H-quinone oxidoreductase [Alphaproteobacteria bacterium]